MTKPRMLPPIQYYDHVVSRFMSRVDKAKSGCWEWLTAKTGGGYGTFSIKGISYPAHRVLYELFNGKIPDGLLVCHQCDNPGCVNPNHLWVGTQSDNVKDAYEKGRAYISDKTKATLSAFNTGKKHSLETKMKLSAAHKGKKVSDTTKAKLSALNSGENHPMYGKKQSKETRAKIGAAHKGKIVTAETLAKMSAARKGKKWSSARRAAQNKRR